MSRTTLLGLCCAALLVSSIPVAATETEVARDPESVRNDLSEVLRLSARLTRDLDLDDTRVLILEADAMLETLPDEDIAEIAAAVPMLDEWRSALADAIKAMPTGSRAKGSRSASGFPTSVDFPATCSNELAPGGVLAALIVKQVAAGALAVAEYVCKQTIPVPIVGGCVSTASACTVLAIAANAADAIYEGFAFCIGERHGARLVTADDKLIHIHGDMESRAAAQDTTFDGIQSQLTTSQTNINTRSDALGVRITTLQSELAQRGAAHDADLDNALAAVDQVEAMNLATMRRIDVERALAQSRNVDVASLVLTTNFGGDLDVVRQVVNETITNFIAAGLAVGQAQRDYDAGVAAQVAGQFREAFRRYSLAYQESVRGLR